MPSVLLRRAKWLGIAVLAFWGVHVAGASCPVAVRRFLVAALVLWVVAVVALALRQRAMIYYPPERPVPSPESLGLPAAAAVQVEGLTMWALPPKNGRPTVVFYHGNAGDRASWAGRGRDLAAHGYGVVMADYPGYGGNPGRSTEASVYAAARAAAVLARHMAAGAPVVAWGQSLGSGAAVEVAAERLVDDLILESAFTSLPDVTAGVMWWAPARWLTLDRYDNLGKLRQVRMPLLLMHGDADPLVPIAQAHANYAVAGQDKRMLVVPGGGHNMHWEEVAGAAFAFLDAISARPH